MNTIINLLLWLDGLSVCIINFPPTEVVAHPCKKIFSPSFSLSPLPSLSLSLSLSLSFSFYLSLSLRKH